MYWVNSDALYLICAGYRSSGGTYTTTVYSVPSLPNIPVTGNDYYYYIKTK